jgi:alpha-D-xyloside xylohydrolase
MVLALALGCRDEVVPPSGDGAPYDVVFDGRALHLRRDEASVLVLPIDGVVVGEVAAYESDRSYDPFFPLALADGGVAWRAAESVSGALPSLRLSFGEGASATLTVREDGEGRFGLSLVPTAGQRPIAFLRLRFAIDGEEGLYGLGSALDHVNRRGSTRATQLEVDETTEAFSNEAHVHLPFVLGTTGWGMLVRDDHPTVFELGVEADDLLQVTVGTGEATPGGLAFDLYVADHPLDVTARYWQATGAHRLPARWALGPWHWRDENEDQAEVEADLQTLRDLDLATSAVWIDRPYATGVNTFDFEAVKFPEPQAMIDLAHRLGFRMALWHTPYVAEEETGPLFTEAEASGWFPPVHPPSFISWGTPIDLTNPEAYDWWQDLLGQYSAMGVEGYKLDYAEEILVGAFGGRLAWEFSDGSDERTMHAQYQRLYHQVYAETLPETGGFLLCRTAAWGDQVNGPIIWPGDLDATMDRWGDAAVDRDGEAYVAVGGLPASLVDALSLGPSGFPFYASDTGGYRHSPPDDETFTRWFQQTALSSVMQVGNSSNDVVWEPDAINGFDAATLDGFRVFTRLHLRLWPYLWTEAAAVATGEGRPLMRPLGLAYPELGVHPDDVYLLGDALLVAPVVDRGARDKEVVFPPGRWIDWFRGDVHGEGTETVPAALDELPLYLVEGGIVPLLRPTVDTLAPTEVPGTAPGQVDSAATTPGILWPRVFPGPASERVLFDGTRIAQESTGDGVTLEWTGGDEFRDGAIFEVVGAPKPAGVTGDGAALPERPDLAAVEADGGWTWTPDVGGTVFLRTSPGDGVRYTLY